MHIIILITNSHLRQFDETLPLGLARRMVGVANEVFPDAPVVLCTDSPLSADWDLSPVVSIPPCSTDPISYQEELSAIHAKCVRSGALEDSDEAVMVLNTSYPTLSAEDIAEAHSLWAAAPDLPLISMATARDHPCQLKRMSITVDSGIIYLFERPGAMDSILSAAGLDASDWNLSKPFPYPWPSWAEEGVPYALEQLSGANQLVMTAPEKNETIWLRQGDTARIATRDSGLSATLVPTMESSSYGITMTQSDESEIGVHASKSTDNMRMKLVPFNEHGAMPHISEEFDIPDSGSLSLQTSSEACGYIYTVSAENVSGKIDGITSFDTGGVCWSGKTNLATGQRMTGRQSMPQVFSLKPALTLTRPSHLNELADRAQSGDFTQYPIDPVKQFPIRNQVDMIRFSFAAEETHG